MPSVCGMTRSTTGCARWHAQNASSKRRRTMRRQTRRDEGPKRSSQLLGKRRREPLLVTLGRPATVADEQAIDLGRHQRVNHVGRLALSEPGPESVRARERACDPALTLIALALDLVENFRGRAIGSGRAHEDGVDVV